MTKQSLDELYNGVSDVELEENVSENVSENDDNSEEEEEKEEKEEEEELDITGGGAEDSEDYEDENFGGVEEEKEDTLEANKSKIKQLEEAFTDEDDEDDEPDENYLMKFDKEIRKNYLVDFHPETLTNNYAEIQALVNITRDDRGIIIDEFHKTLPFLTKYEKTRILGQRAKQINSGSTPYIDLKTNFDNKRVIDGYLIALKELELKRIPFIIRRPLPNGGSEYWRLQDLELIN